MANAIVSGLNSCTNGAYNLYEALKPKDGMDLLRLTTATVLYLSGYHTVPLAIATVYVGVNLRVMYLVNNVRTIYVPPKHSNDLIEAQKIKELQSRKDVQKVETVDGPEQLPWPILGVTSIPTRDNQTECPVYIKSITRKEDGHERIQFSLHDVTDDKEIGFAVFRLCGESSNFYNDFFVVEKPLVYTGYGFDKADIDKIVLLNISNKYPTLYKNVGVVLLKAILQYYKNYDCRISLDAVWHSHAYFYKLGFRVSDISKLHLNKRFSEMASSTEISTKDNGYCVMHLPTEARELWQEEIKTNPITFF